MTDFTTNSSRRERRRQAQPQLARAVVHNAGRFGRGAAIVATASGLMASSAVAANAVPNAEPNSAPAEQTESGAIPGQTLNDYLPGTRGVVEQLAQLQGVGAESIFEQLIADRDYVAGNGELDHSALLDRVSELSDESSSAEEPAQSSGQTLADYLPGTTGVVEQLAALEGVDADSMFEQLINDPAYVADNGELDHMALVERVAELSGQNDSADEAQEQAPAQDEAEEAPVEEAPAEESSQGSSQSLADYLPGTTGLVEELAALEGTSASAKFQELINDSSYTNGGVLDHAALQSRVAELSGQDEAAEPQQQAETAPEPQPEPEPQQAEQQSELDVDVNQDGDGFTVTSGAESQDAGSLSGVVSAAYSGLGTPYVWGGKGPGGWDCSGFVSWAYAQAGYDIPSSTSTIQASSKLRWTSNPQPGDLVIQNGGGHVAIYVGNGQFIGAQNPDTGTLQYSYESRPYNTHVGYLTLR